MLDEEGYSIEWTLVIYGLQRSSIIFTYLVVEVGHNVFEAFAALAHDHVQGHFDIVKIDKSGASHSRAGQRN